MAKRLLTLIKNNKMRVAYPRTDDDFKLLKELGVSVRLCSVDFLPLLGEYARAKKVKLEILAFDLIQEKALANLQKRWPGDFQKTVKAAKTQVTLSCPKDDKHKALMVSVKKALSKFYRTHGYKMEYLIKRGSRNVKVLFLSEPNPKFFDQSEV